MSCQNAPSKVLKASYRGQTKCRYQEMPYCRQKILFSPLAALQPPLLKWGAAPVADDYGPQFPNQNLKYTIDFGALPNMGGATIKMMAPANQYTTGSTVTFQTSHVTALTSRRFFSEQCICA